MTRDMAKTDATFEATWPRHQFAPLVGLVLALAQSIRAAASPADKRGNERRSGPVYQ